MKELQCMHEAKTVGVVNSTVSYSRLLASTHLSEEDDDLPLPPFFPPIPCSLPRPVRCLLNHSAPVNALLNEKILKFRHSSPSRVCSHPPPLLNRFHAPRLSAMGKKIMCGVISREKGRRISQGRTGGSH